VKNKKFLYILLPLTVLIWSLIIYNLLKNYFPKEKPYYEFDKGSIEINRNVVLDTFTLINNYKDPFLSSAPIIKESVDKLIVLPKNNETVIWPEIYYKGNIINHISKKIIVNVQINKRDYLIKESEIIDELQLIKINEDSVLFRYKNLTKWIKRAK
jgi:hypothetical protein